MDRVETASYAAGNVHTDTHTHTYTHTHDTLSHNQNTRNQAKSDIDTLMGKMNGLV